VGVSVDRVNVVKVIFKATCCKGVQRDGSRLFQAQSNCFRSKENLSAVGVTTAKLVGAVFQSRPALLDIWI
jgi:hypothetical protein